MIERGQVVAVAEDGVDVRIESGEACRECDHCSRVDKSGMLLTDVRDDVGVHEGDMVEVEIPRGADTRAAAIAYVAPVVVLLVGYGLGRAIAGPIDWDPDVTGAAVGIGGVATGMYAMRRRIREVLSGERFRPKVRAIMTAGQQPRPGRSGGTGAGPQGPGKAEMS